MFTILNGFTLSFWVSTYIVIQYLGEAIFICDHLIVSNGQVDLNKRVYSCNGLENLDLGQGSMR